MNEKIFDRLNPKQREAVECLEGPLLILAGAGSGKTRVLTHRIANLLAHGVDPHEILAITFTNKAANEMKSRVQNLVGEDAREIWLSTFHSFCARILRMEIEITGRYQKNFVIYDASDSKTMIRKCLHELFHDNEEVIEQIDLSSIQSMISKAKNDFIDAKHFEYWRKEYRSRKNLPEVLSESEMITAKIYELYTEKLIENNALDFDDLLLVTVAMFHNFPEILQKYQRRFKYISIDEYQDTNGVQYRLAKMLAESHHNICVVGDADQSIYGWRGADFRNILNFEEDYPEARTIQLEQNYRSTKKILDAANSVIENNVVRKPKNLWTQKSGGDPIKLFEARTAYQEAEFVVREIQRQHLMFNVPYRDFAILYRVNWQSRLIEEKLIRSEIPYIIIGGLKFFDRKEIKDILAYLRILTNSSDEISLLRAIGVPKRGIGSSTLEKIAEIAADHGITMFDTIARVNEINIRPAQKHALENFMTQILDWINFINAIPLDQFIKQILEESGMLDEIKALPDETERENRLKNLDEFLELARDFSNSTEDRSLENFLMQISLMTSNDDEIDAEDRVSLMTVHSAKGLEFPIVFVVGLEEGVFPHMRSLNVRDEMEEERRACYVAITRAERNLYLSYALERNMFGKISRQKPSRFIDEIPPECFESRNQVEIDFKPRQISKPISKPNPIQNLIPKPKPNPKIDLKIGDRVKHSMFGIGIVQKIAGSGDLSQLTIHFDDVGTKVLVKKFAPLEKFV